MMIYNDFLQGDNKCQTAEDNGVSILHGNALAFVKVMEINHTYLVMGESLVNNWETLYVWAYSMRLQTIRTIWSIA